MARSPVLSVQADVREIAPYRKLMPVCRTPVGEQGGVTFENLRPQILQLSFLGVGGAGCQNEQGAQPHDGAMHVTRPDGSALRSPRVIRRCAKFHAT